jgi:hypothetical protein
MELFMEQFVGLDVGVVQNLPFSGYTGVRNPPVREDRISARKLSCAGGG